MIENLKNCFLSILFIISCCLFIISCNNPSQPPGIEIVNTPEDFNLKSTDLIRKNLDFAIGNKGKIDDSISLLMAGTVAKIYESDGYKPVWEENRKWTPYGEELIEFISNAKLYGLFPEDYYHHQLVSIQNRFQLDTLGKSDSRDAALWTRADLMMTSAFIQIVKDIKLGRLPQDSISLRSDSVLTDDFYLQQLNELQKKGSLQFIVNALEPMHKGYHELKAGIKEFLSNEDTNMYVKVPPLKNSEFKTVLQQRLFQGGFIDFDSTRADSLQLAQAVKKFQKHAGINVDGKIGEVSLRLLNTSDIDRFISIAITLDRYKMLPEKMPDRYLWVNLPGYYLRLIENDSDKLFSKIIVGKTNTRSPVLNSSISEIITYPQWTIPQSIIVKEIIPAAKKNPGYITKKGFSLLDSKGNVVSPDSVNWSKYNKGIPYRVVQGSGDANALGVMKFNFSNKYSVYLHDTNQRSLFNNSDRAMSHGCVRVQNWEELAYNILRNESAENTSKEDSVKQWLQQKRKHSIPIMKRLPLFIRYFTCVGENGKIRFYDDIYGEDKMLYQKYFKRN